MTLRWGLGGIDRLALDIEEMRGVVSVELDAMLIDSLRGTMFHGSRKFNRSRAWHGFQGQVVAGPWTGTVAGELLVNETSK